MPRHAAEIVQLYRRHAHAWSAARARESSAQLMETAWLDQFLVLLPPTPKVLDLGCGPGAPIASYLAERSCVITGVDSAPEMIAMAQALLPQHAWHEADMRTLSLGQTFNGILAWDSFFHLTPEDQRHMFPIFRAHAAPRAALMFTSGPAHGVAMGTLESEPLYHASLAPEEYHALLAESAFAVVAHTVEDPKCGGHTIWLAQKE